jgi:hypothetical protein
MVDVDISFVLHLDAKELVAGLPGFGFDGVKGFAEESVVDGLLFEESAEVLKKHGIGDADGSFTERPSFTLHEEECADDIFGRKIGFTIFDGRDGQFGEVVVQEFQDGGHGQEELVDPVVLVVILVYNLGRLVVFGLPEHGKNGMCYFTHRSLLGV